MCEGFTPVSFTGEGKKKGISFTRNTHCINKLRVKVEGEGRNCELAECAMRRGVFARAYEAAEEETANAGVGKERASFPKKMGRKKRKEGEFRKKVHKFSFSLSLCSKNETFFSQKIRRFETKLLLLRLIKHNFPFVPPPCGVYIAQSRGTFPDPPAQMLFDLLKHRDFALSLPIETCPKDAIPPNRETLARLRHAPWILYGKRRVKAYFSSTRKGALAFFGQRALD